LRDARAVVEFEGLKFRHAPASNGIFGRSRVVRSVVSALLAGGHVRL